MSEHAFDVVVIGAGLGGLTAAATLAKEGRKVCVLERNHAVGGAASTFKIGALTVEPSLHQTADPRDPAQPTHAILRRLGLLETIEWAPVSPFYTVRGGPIGEAFDLPVGFSAVREALAARFPESAAASDALVSDMERLSDGIADLVMARDEHSLKRLARGAIELRGALGQWRLSLHDAFERAFGENEGPRCALAGNLAYYADDPRTLRWLFFAAAQGGYLRSGGVYVKGGSRVLSLKLAKVVMRAGGAVRLGRDATAIVSDEFGRAAWVRHVDAKSRGDEEALRAQVVLANCAPSVVADMLDEPAKGAFAAAYRGRPLSTSLFTAHFGLKVAPSKFGLTHYGQIVLPAWMRALDETPLSAKALAADPGERLPIYGIANYSAIDSGLAEGGPALVTAVGLDRLDNWAGLTREQEKARRERWLDCFQAALDRDYPGFASAVAERQFLNARSMRGFLNTPEGAVYGFAPSPPHSLWVGPWRGPRTPIPNLFLASAFGGGGGFTGAMMTGAEAAEMAASQLRARVAAVT